MTLQTRLEGAEPAAIAELAARHDATREELAALAACLGHARKAIQRPAAEAFANLAARGVNVTDVLDAALASADPRRRFGAAFALSLLGPPPPHTLPVLCETLGSDDGDMRWAAEKIVLRLADRGAVQRALAELLRAGSPEQRKMALYTLRDLSECTTEAEAAVLAALDDPLASVRQAAITCTPHLVADRPRAAARLLAALEDPDERLRRGAAAALGALGEPTAAVVTALRQAAASTDAALARAAARALRLLAV